ncbi:unnamed protein product [Owenia fusiformis]|uniref:C2H2-type domain-containing protein n=1 Tax=Owenia fusiformis TaxID=6347 RepID=A0A8S4PBD4_OWEFU|nr:unnamed protein product [Owenia fusiformis]
MENFRLSENGDVNVVIKQEPIDDDGFNITQCIKDEPLGAGYKSENGLDISKKHETTVVTTTVHTYRQETITSIKNGENTIIKEEYDVHSEEGEHFSREDLQTNQIAIKLETEEMKDHLNPNEIEFKVEDKEEGDEDTIFAKEEYDDLDGFDAVEQKQDHEELNDHQIDDDNTVLSDDTNDINNANVQQTVKKHFECQFCKKSFTRKYRLDKHLIIHNPNLFQCEVCEEFLKTSSQLKNHMLMMHPKSNRKCFKCQYCYKLFKIKQNWKEHETIHTGKPHKCDICEKTFARKQNLKRHEAVAHTKDKATSTSKKGNVDNIAQSFTRKYRLDKHLIIHNPNLFQCEVCEEFLKTSSQLKNHMLMIHPKINRKCFKCQYCYKLFKIKQNWKEHETIHTGKPHKCDICEKTFNRKQNLKRHEAVAHTRDKATSTSKKGNVDNIAQSQPYDGNDNVCLNTNKDIGGLLDVKEESSPVKDKSLICCGITFSSTKTLEVHKRLHSMHKNKTKNTSLKCQYCEMTFAEMNLLKDHERKHTGEKPFKCQFCETYFRTRKNRCDHEKNRCYIGKPFKCGLCGKGYATLPLLKAHEEYMHIKEKQ